jgi:lysozyme family protein
MANFDDAIPTVLKHEGGFVDNPIDSGSATNFGVSLRWLKSQGLLEELEAEEGDKTQNEVQVMKTMTIDQAKGFYKCWWWDRYRYDLFTAQPVANKILDVSVNIGPSRAHRLLQGVLGLPEDGVLGSKTFNEANSVASATLVVKFQTSQAAFYRSLVAKNPKLAVFLNGWIARAYDRN